MRNTQTKFSRRLFCTAATLLGPAVRRVSGKDLDPALRAAMERHKVPEVVASAATAKETIYSGAFGTHENAIFRIASMTKPVTTVAAMQLVERGVVTLDEPASKHLPQLGALEVLDGFDRDSGKPILHPARHPVTLRLLLSHSAGFAYDGWDAKLSRYRKQVQPAAATAGPLMFEPGAQWQYGTNVDWAGRLVEAASGQTLEQYFNDHILQPLGMKDTGFNLPPEKFDRLVSTWHRGKDGVLVQDPRTLPSPPKSFNGGGGLYSTAGDYVRFMQMILRDGMREGRDRILKAQSVHAMASNQIGALSAGKLQSNNPEWSADVDFHPGFEDKFGLGFLINNIAYEGGRSAGSLAWAGIDNTFFWIDRRRRLCGVVMMQFLPFCDAAAIGMLRDFEHAVYAAV